MHEMSIAMNVVDIACKEAAADGAQRVQTIELEVGKLAGVMIDSLEFCFEAACRDTIADGATLKINELPGIGQCEQCHKEFEVENFITACPHCETFQINIKQGRELRLVAISVE